VRIDDWYGKINTISSFDTIKNNANPLTDSRNRSFSQYFMSALEKVNQAQIEAETMSKKLASGQIVNVHDVMIAQEKASISLRLAVEVRNKVVEAYQEIMRMQV
jgi:flagellar hook-basal body complex protein FliE